MAAPARRQSKRLMEQTTNQKAVPGGLVSVTKKRAPRPAPAKKLAITRPIEKSDSGSQHMSHKRAGTKTAGSQERLVLPDASAWRSWLDANETASDGVWLVLAKKGVTEPTSLTRAQALDEALCSGWIDSQGKSLDQFTSIQRYTPRRAKSLWSAINVGHVARLRDEGRMKERGEMEIARAKEDGRWQRAYAGPSNMTVPPELATVLGSNPVAKERLESMKNMERYSLLLPIVTAHTETARRKKFDKLIEDLTRSG